MGLPRGPGDVGRCGPPVAGRFRCGTKRAPDEAGAEGRTRDVVRVAGGRVGRRLGQAGGVRRAAGGTGHAGYAGRYRSNPKPMPGELSPLLKAPPTKKEPRPTRCTGEPTDSALSTSCPTATTPHRPSTTRPRQAYSPRMRSERRRETRARV